VYIMRAITSHRIAHYITAKVSLRIILKIYVQLVIGRHILITFFTHKATYLNN